MDRNVDKAMEMRTDKLNARRIFQNNIGKTDLTTAENISGLGIDDLDPDPSVSVGMMEGTSNGDPVGIVFCHTVAVVDQKAQRVSAEITVYKHIVSAVVDTSVPIAGAMYIGELMKFAEMGDVNSHSATHDMAVGCRHARAHAGSRIQAGQATARKVAIFG